MLQSLCDKLNCDINSLNDVFLGTPAPAREPGFEPRIFQEEKPRLKPVTKKGLFARLWPPMARQIDARGERCKRNYEHRLREWLEAKQAFEKRERERQRRETELVWNDLDTMSAVLNEHLRYIPWLQGTYIDFALGEHLKTIAIDIQFPSVERIPAIEWSIPVKQLKVTKRVLSTTRRRQIYKDYVHGAGVRALGEVFRRLPTVDVALLSGYAKWDRSLMANAHSCIYSVIAQRSGWEEINFDALNTVESASVLDRFNLRRSMTETAVFRPIEPFNVKDLEQAADEARPILHSQTTKRHPSATADVEA